jgi:hypothetical protein
MRVAKASKRTECRSAEVSCGIFRMFSVLLTDGMILRLLEVTSLIMTGGGAERGGQ